MADLPKPGGEQDQYWELALNPNPDWVARYPVSAQQTMDGMMVFTLREFQSMTLRKYAPVSVHFSYIHPEAQTEYRSIFQCPVHIGSDKTALHLRKEQLADEVNNADYQLLGLLVRYAEDRLRKLEREPSFADQVRRTILNMAPPQFPGIRQAAANLNMSVRTLQRRLKEEGLYHDSPDFGDDQDARLLTAGRQG